MNSTVIKEMIMKMFVAEMIVRYNISDAEKMLPLINDEMKREWEKLYGVDNEYFVYNDVSLDFVGLGHKLVREEDNYVVVNYVSARLFCVYVKHSVNGWYKIFSDRSLEKLMKKVEFCEIPSMNEKMIDRLCEII